MNKCDQIPVDSWGKTVTIENPLRRREWFWYFNSQDLAPGLPLYVQFCGNSIWGPDVAITRKNSLVHSHELVTAGSINLAQGGKSYYVTAGQICAIRKEVDHSYRTGPEGLAHRRVVSIEGDLFEAIMRRLGLWETDVFHVSDTRTFVEYAKAGARLLRDRPPGFRQKLSELAYSMLLFLGAEREGLRYPKPIQQALDYMHSRINQSVSLAGVARAACLSIPHFCRVFRKHMGVPPLDYFRSLKVRHARELLAMTTASVKEIAFNLGFENMAHFTRLFVTQTGVSPREYRKKGL